MKKLLLILICLFVSFEVKSKEDLSGLKLLCDYKTFSEGFEFYKDKKAKLSWVKVFYLSKDTGNLSVKEGAYLTSTSEITIFTLETRTIETRINRQNPEPCQKFSGDFESLFKKKSNEIIKKLKSGQKF